MKYMMASVCLGLAACLWSPSQALACGGFFCSRQPVEQNNERILFEIDEAEGTISATVEIAYTGNPDDFSWVVPVGGTPELELVPADTLRVLDAATTPRVIPPQDPCGGLGGGRQSGFGCSEDSLGRQANLATKDGGSGVNVEDLPQVGPFDSVVISSEDPNAIIDWLNENDYVITEEMEPFVAAYVRSGMKFLAMRMAPNSSAAEVAPVKMTWGRNERVAPLPMIPLVMTSVAAEPEMGIVVFIIADAQYEAFNWDNIKIAKKNVKARFFGSNYRPLVSKAIDEAGGNAFITEMALQGDAVMDLVDQWAWIAGADTRGYLESALSPTRRVTRLFSRISAWEVSEDPMFRPTGSVEVEPVIDLSNQELGGCAQADPPCGNTYCGPGASCATTDMGDGCLCDNGQVARFVESGGFPMVICQERYWDLMASLYEGFGDSVPGDPCNNYACGPNGSCVTLNGFPTCHCDSGFAAVPQWDGSLTCIEAAEVHDAGSILSQIRTSGDGNGSEGDGCTLATRGDFTLAGLILLLGLTRIRRRLNR